MNEQVSDRILIIQAAQERAPGLRARLEADGYRVVEAHSLVEMQQVPEIMPARIATIRIGAALIDLEQSVIYKNGSKFRLTRQESKLLNVLIRGAGRPIRRQELLKRAWGYSADAQTRTLDYFITRLRRKVEDRPAHPEHIVTVRGVGYELKP